MENGAKNRIVPVVLSVIGLIADLIGIYVFLGIKEDVTIDDKILFLIIGIIIIFYSLLSISWYFIDRAIKKRQNDAIVNTIVKNVCNFTWLSLLPFYITFIISIEPKFEIFFFLGYILIRSLNLIILQLITPVFNIDINIENGIEIENSVFTLFVSLILGGLITSAIYFHNPLGYSGKYLCTFPYKGKNINIEQYSKVNVIYNDTLDQAIIFNTIGSKDTITLKQLQTFFGKEF